MTAATFMFAISTPFVNYCVLGLMSYAAFGASMAWIGSLTVLNVSEDLVLPVACVMTNFLLRMHLLDIPTAVLRGFDEIRSRVYLRLLLASSHSSWFERGVMWLRGRGVTFLAISHIHLGMQILVGALLATWPAAAGGALAWALFIGGGVLAGAGILIERSFRYEFEPRPGTLWHNPQRQGSDIGYRLVSRAGGVILTTARSLEELATTLWKQPWPPFFIVNVDRGRVLTRLETFKVWIAQLFSWRAA